MTKERENPHPHTHTHTHTNFLKSTGLNKHTNMYYAKMSMICPAAHRPLSNPSLECF